MRRSSGARGVLIPQRTALGRRPVRRDGPLARARSGRALPAAARARGGAEVEIQLAVARAPVDALLG